MATNRKPVTLITGYRGLAETLIASFLQADHQVSALVRQETALAPLKEKFPTAHFHVGDVVDKEACRSWINAVAKRFGHLDCLINNAALPGPAGKLHEIEFPDFEKSLAVNLTAPVYLSQLVLQHHHKTPGSQAVIVNLSGGGATFPRPGFSAYAITKTALVRMTETLAGEYPQHRFYAISPGGLMTPMIEAILRMDPSKIEKKEFAEAERRAAHGGDDPRKAAELLLWLFREKPTELSGKLLHAVWDDYKNFHRYPAEVGWWALRRVDEVCKKTLLELP